jgi:electron transport complex protein RnfB
MPEQHDVSRRGFLAEGVRGSALLAMGGVVGAVLGGRRSEPLVWQIDPGKCIQCTHCATDCVLNPSAVKCLNDFARCGYCKLCTGYYEPQVNPEDLTTAAEVQLCPTGALIRKWVEGEYYEYTIDPALCIGCARCVKGCKVFKNRSLFLQIDRKLCVNCNNCSIAAVCPSGAIGRVPLSESYLLKENTRTA